MGLFDRDPTTKSGLKPKPGPVATEKLRLSPREMKRVHEAYAKAKKETQ